MIGAETIDSLPAIYGNRWANRGIEGMAFNSKDGLLYAFMQSPLAVSYTHLTLPTKRIV